MVPQGPIRVVTPPPSSPASLSLAGDDDGQECLFDDGVTVSATIPEMSPVTIDTTSSNDSNDSRILEAAGRKSIGITEKDDGVRFATRTSEYSEVDSQKSGRPGHLVDSRQRGSGSFRVGRGSRCDILGVTLRTKDFVNLVDDVDLKWYHYSWVVILGFAGLLDILAMAGPHIRTLGGCDEFLLWPSTAIFVSSLEDTTVFCSVWVPMIRWLESNNVTISFVFSVLWFKHSFIKAMEDRHQCQDKRDRRRLLHSSHVSRNLTRQDKKSKSKSSLNPQLVYYRRIFVQLVLLPVGFYVILYNSVRSMYNEGKMLGLLDELKETDSSEIVFTIYDEQDDTTRYEVFTERSRIALVFALLKHFYLSVLATTAMARVALISFARQNALSQIRPLIRKVMRNPLKFRRQLKVILKYLRWIKYTAPLIGGLNKLKAQVADLLKKRRQHIEAKKQKRIREKLWEKKSQAMKEGDAAIMVQSAFRSHRARKYTNAVLLLTEDRKAISAAKIQSQLRRKLANARVRLIKKRQELELLEHQRKASPEELSDKDRKRMYELQDQFASEAKRIINRKLLLPPNTRFAVTWKVLFVIAIVVEISQKAVAPWLHEKRAQRTGKHMTLREFAAESLIPTRVAEMPECAITSRRLPFSRLFPQKRENRTGVDLQDYATNSMPWICHGPFSTWWDGYRDFMALALTPSPVREWPECRKHVPSTIRQRFAAKVTKKKMSPWYCSEPYASTHAFYRWYVDGFIDHFVVLVSIICFLDVFVTFFTGEIHPASGELVPKPFFARWISPGLLIQLMLNPAIDTVSDCVFDAVRRIYSVGPVRVWRWLVAVIFPIVYGLCKAVMVLALKESRPKDQEVVKYQLKKKRY